MFLIKKEKIFAVEENSGLNKRELLKYDESFLILVFEANLSIKIAL